jgi:hypothetical protein
MREDNSHWFIVRRSQTGLGLFTARSFSRGDFIIEYTGTLLRNEEADRRGGKYLFRVNSRWTIDGRGRENLSRYINHSCRPNCVAYTRGRKVKIYSLRKIAAGEELTYNYGKEYFDAYIRPRGCLCASCSQLGSSTATELAK